MTIWVLSALFTLVFMCRLVNICKIIEYCSVINKELSIQKSKKKLK